MRSNRAHLGPKPASRGTGSTRFWCHERRTSRPRCSTRSNAYGEPEFLRVVERPDACAPPRVPRDPGETGPEVTGGGRASARAPGRTGAIDAPNVRRGKPSLGEELL